MEGIDITLKNCSKAEAEEIFALVKMKGIGSTPKIDRLLEELDSDKFGALKREFEHCAERLNKTLTRGDMDRAMKYCCVSTADVMDALHESPYFRDIIKTKTGFDFDTVITDNGKEILITGEIHVDSQSS